MFDFVRTGVVETDEENEERSSETDEEYTPVKKKQGADLINEERTGKRKRKETKKEKDEVIESALAKISDEDLKKAEKEAKNLNFKKGNADYVALVVLSMGKAVRVTEMSGTTITGLASKWSLGGKTANGKPKMMGLSAIQSALRRDNNTNYFVVNIDGTYSLANTLEKKEKTTEKEKEIEAIKTAVAGFDNKVLEEAKAEANNLNFTVGSGAYVALVVLLAGKAVGITSMNPTTVVEFACQLGLEGKTKNGEKTKMDRSTISKAMERDKINFKRNEDGTYSLANKLEKKKETKKKEKEERKSEPRVVHVKRGEWDLTKFKDVLFYGNKNKWCPLCNGRTVVNRTFVMFYSHWLLPTMAEEVLIEHYGNEKKIKTERIKKGLDYYFEKKLKTNPRSDIKSFDDVCRQGEELCHHCWTKLEKWLKT